MHLNIRTYDREVYNALDWLGDLGGLYDGLRGILLIFLGILTYKRYDNFMVAQLYQCQTEKVEPENKAKGIGKLMSGMSTYFEKEINKEYLNERKVASLKMLFFDCLSSKLRAYFDHSKILNRNQ